MDSKIQVRLADPAQNARIMTGILMTGLKQVNQSLPFCERVYKVFPTLRNQVQQGMSRQKIEELVRQAVDEKYEQEQEKMLASLTRVERLVENQISQAVHKMIEEFELEWREEEVITCSLGLFNPFPRSVRTCEYWLHYGVPDHIIVRLSLHEINHFILFRKWAAMHGYGKEGEPDFPETLWFLEEMAVEPTMNIKEVLEITHDPERAYDMFYEKKRAGKSMEQYIKEFYAQRNSMEEFLDRSYQFIEQNKEILVQD